MEIFSVFSIADFLAYLFPGILSLSGIYLILLQTPLRHLLRFPDDFGAWLAILIFSYITGVIIATITDIFFRERKKSARRRQNKGAIQLHDEKLKSEIMEAFNEFVFRKSETTLRRVKQPPPSTSEWNESYYYVCRSLVIELMPRAGASGIREGAYRQLRMNLIGSIVILGIAGVLWGVVLFLESNTIQLINGDNIGREWAAFLIAISILLPVYLVSQLRISMDKHEQREVREILTSFLSGYKAGVFDKHIKR